MLRTNIYPVEPAGGAKAAVNKIVAVSMSMLTKVSKKWTPLLYSTCFVTFTEFPALSQCSVGAIPLIKNYWCTSS